MGDILDYNHLNMLPLERNKETFELLFKQYYSRLTAYACLFLDRDAAEDVVQGMFAYLWEKAGSVTIHTSLDAYLFRSVYQRCLNQINLQKSRNYHHKILENYLFEFEFKIFDPDKNDSIRKLFMDELSQDINNAIDSLPPKCREVFLLSYLHSLKNREIAEILRVSLSTVENHVYNALKILRVKLAKYSQLILLFFTL